MRRIDQLALRTDKSINRQDLQFSSGPKEIEDRTYEHNVILQSMYD